MIDLLTPVAVGVPSEDRVIWQPIETAPRNGTRVLFWDSRRQVAVSGCWHTEPTRDTPNGYDPGWAWWTSDDDLIMWDSGPDDTPTHWMPLPEPPKE